MFLPLIFLPSKNPLQHAFALWEQHVCCCAPTHTCRTAHSSAPSCVNSFLHHENTNKFSEGTLKFSDNTKNFSHNYPTRNREC